jgi:hypothetical protein
MRRVSARMSWMSRMSRHVASTVTAHSYRHSSRQSQPAESLVTVSMVKQMWHIHSVISTVQITILQFSISVALRSSPPPPLPNIKHHNTMEQRNQEKHRRSLESLDTGSEIDHVQKEAMTEIPAYFYPIFFSMSILAMAAAFTTSSVTVSLTV